MAVKGLGIYKRGRRWRLDCFIDGERYFENLGEVSRSVAEDEAMRIRREIADGKRKPKKEDPLFSKLFDDYEKEPPPELAEGTLKAYRSYIKKHLRPFFGELRVSDLNEVVEMRYKRQRKKELTERKGPDASLTSINRELDLLRTVLNLYRLPNPLERYKRFPESKKERILDEETGEAEKLLQVINEKYPGRLADFFELMLYTGYRRSELLGLRNAKEMIDWNAFAIRIPRRLRKGKFEDVETPITQAIETVLKRALKGVEEGARLFPWPGHYVWNRWNRIRKAAGMEDLRMHDLRHTFLTWASEHCGGDYAALQKLAGHRSYRTTERYVHPTRARTKKIMERMQERQERISQRNSRHPIDKKLDVVNSVAESVG